MQSRDFAQRVETTQGTSRSSSALSWVQSTTRLPESRCLSKQQIAQWSKQTEQYLCRHTSLSFAS